MCTPLGKIFFNIFLFYKKSSFFNWKSHLLQKRRNNSYTFGVMQIKLFVFGQKKARTIGAGV